jgi:hypothetical protein
LPPRPSLQRGLAISAAVIFYAGMLAVGFDASFGTNTAAPTRLGVRTGTKTTTDVATPTDELATATTLAPGATPGLGGRAAPGGRKAAGSSVGGRSPIPVPPLVSTTKLPSQSPGVTDNEIEIGVEALTNVGAAYAAIGYNGVVPTDADVKNIADAIADAVNRRGGIAGRKMVPVLHLTDITQGTHDTRGQAACSFFTEDHHVFAVVAQGNHGDAFASCLAQRHVPLIDDANSQPLDDGDLARLAPYVWSPGKLDLSRFGAYIDTLSSAGFFTPGSKVGLLRYDTQNQVRARDNVIIPALARHGIQLTDDFGFSAAQSVSDLSLTAAQATNAAVRFRGKGIDHVIFLPSAGVITTVFPVAAEDQQYRPRYGITTAELPNNMTSNSPPGQLDNALLVGWSTSTDRGTSFVNDGNPLWVYCRAVMREHGTLEAGAYGCGAYFFLQEALARATEASAVGIRGGADKLGRTRWSTGSYGTNIKPGHFDGTGAVVLYRYEGGCGCFEPSGGPTDLP